MDDSLSGRAKKQKDIRVCALCVCLKGGEAQGCGPMKKARNQEVRTARCSSLSEREVALYAA